MLHIGILKIISQVKKKKRTLQSDPWTLLLSIIPWAWTISSRIQVQLFGLNQRPALLTIPKPKKHDSLGRNIPTYSILTYDMFLIVSKTLLDSIIECCLTGSVLTYLFPHWFICFIVEEISNYKTMLLYIVLFAYK